VLTGVFFCGKLLLPPKEKTMTEKDEQPVDRANVSDVLNLQVKDLLVMMAEEGGTYADFSFRDKKTNELLAFFAIGLVQTAEKMREIFYKSIDEFDAAISFEGEVGESGNE